MEKHNLNESSTYNVIFSLNFSPPPAVVCLPLFQKSYIAFLELHIQEKQCLSLMYIVSGGHWIIDRTNIHSIHADPKRAGVHIYLSILCTLMPQMIPLFTLMLGCMCPSPGR